MGNSSQTKNAKALAPRAKLEVKDRLRLQLETGCDDWTIRRWARGESVRPATHDRLMKGCAKLGIELLT